MQLFRPSALRRGLYQGSAQWPPRPLRCSPEGRTKSLSLPLSLLGGPAQARQNLLPSRGRPRLSSHIGRLCSLQRAASSGHRHPPLPAPKSHCLASPPRDNPEAPRGVQATCRVPIHTGFPAVPRGSAAGKTPLCRLPSPGVSVTWPRGLGHVGHGCPSPPTWHPWPSRVGRRGGPGNAGPPGRALPPLPLPPAPAASQSASQRKCRALPASSPPQPPSRHPSHSAPARPGGKPGPVPLGNSSWDLLAFPSLTSLSYQHNPFQTGR